ncbi:flavin-dependent oxidoreductase [Elongatibacter sediminis]|uniref:Flavin-dependent oxidoreductase n=1 Tax=Elongatibacter sediminis TaxID=3119006 RepID=A0AAW9R6Q2_9GAMM
MSVLIAGGGISGMALGLTCHQIGVPFRIYESTAQLKPLGVGINLQPSCVRELFELGLESRLDEVGIRTRDYGMYTKKGLHIWTEPRGEWAGYRWPQYSVHRGKLHMMLYDELIKRAGTDCVSTGWSATGFENRDGKAVLRLKSVRGETNEVTGDLLIGADGIHSAIRAQMYPDEGEPRWGGTILWRGTSRSRPFLTGASMVMVGHDGLRFVSYPISKPDPASGEALINWIATLNYDPDSAWNKEDWNREANTDDFLPRFDGFRFDWLNAPALIEASDKVFEYPMVDRDPLDRWTEGRVSLMGDAAHAAYPVGSNGTGAGIIDARKLGQSFLELGLTPAALEAYETEMRPATSRIILTNRVAGPDKILDIVEERCGGQFDDIHDVITHEEMEEHSRNYKAIAGFGIRSTNESPPYIPAGARFEGISKSTGNQANSPCGKMLES